MNSRNADLAFGFFLFLAIHVVRACFGRQRVANMCCSGAVHDSGVPGPQNDRKRVFDELGTISGYPSHPSRVAAVARFDASTLSTLLRRRRYIGVRGGTDDDEYTRQ